MKQSVYAILFILDKNKLHNMKILSVLQLCYIIPLKIEYLRDLQWKLLISDQKYNARHYITTINICEIERKHIWTMVWINLIMY